MCPPTHPLHHHQLPAYLVLKLVADGLVDDGRNKVGNKTKDGGLLRVARLQQKGMA